MAVFSASEDAAMSRPAIMAVEAEGGSDPDDRDSGESRSFGEALGQGAVNLLLVPWAGVLLSLLLICAALSWYSDYFLTVNNIVYTVALYFSWICIAGFGEGLVLIGGGLDLSVGSTMGFSGTITALALSIGLPLSLSLLAGIASGVAIGLANGLVVTRIGLNPFIATLGTLSVVRGLTYGIVQGNSVALPDTGAANAFSWLGNGTILLVPVPVVIMLCLALVLLVLLTQTAFGRRVYAIGDNENAARLLGIDVKRVKLTLYVLSGTLSAVGGLLLTSKAGTALPDSATGYELEVIAAVVIGGTSLSGGSGTIPGILIGAALLGVIDNGIVLIGINGYWQQTITGLVIVLAATLDIARRRLQARKLR
jgi:ribose transport system permease protein